MYEYIASKTMDTIYLSLFLKNLIITDDDPTRKIQGFGFGSGRLTQTRTRPCLTLNFKVVLIKSNLYFSNKHLNVSIQEHKLFNYLKYN